MGANLSIGFQELPEVYLRDLRRKTRRRFRSILIDHQSELNIAKKKDAVEEKVSELNAQSVAEYIIRNPDFLDDFVKTHVAQDRVRAWIRDPIS
ncbi:uncharacterized protein NPIL_469951, partial [Nephila pilipes]